jgi:hypothetical protein
MSKNMLSKQREDLTQSYEDFERVMEDYFQIIPPDTDFVKVDVAKRWQYNDVERSVTFYFEDAWYLQEFIDKLFYCPKKYSFLFEEHEHIDRENLTVTIIGKIGGLY